MQIVDFKTQHVEQAVQIARQNYDRQRQYTPSLPDVKSWPDLSPFAENKLGVAAVDGDTILGFLCCVSPFPNAFRSTDALGVFSPMHANGAVLENHAEIYARMYQSAAEKWVRAGASSHAVCLYSGDEAAQRQMFEYGFGLRCVDAIRLLDQDFVQPDCPGYTFAEVSLDKLREVLALEHRLTLHYAESPGFFPRSFDIEAAFSAAATDSSVRYFAAYSGQTAVAFLRAEPDGETFICKEPGYIHLNGAFCLPEHRGSGIYAQLLQFAMGILKSYGYTRFGVDYESINPPAFHFWRKHFEEYTHGVVRRIDEYAVGC